MIEHGPDDHLHPLFALACKICNPPPRNAQDELRAKYPHYKIVNDPDPACNCGGKGERTIKPSKLWPNGHSMPCLCVCLSGDHRAEVVQAFGSAAKKAAQDFRAELPDSANG